MLGFLQFNCRCYKYYIVRTEKNEGSSPIFSEGTLVFGKFNLN